MAGNAYTDKNPPMSIRVEDRQASAAVRGTLAGEIVPVLSVRWFGSEPLELLKLHLARSSWFMNRCSRESPFGFCLPTTQVQVRRQCPLP